MSKPSSDFKSLNIVQHWNKIVFRPMTALVMKNNPRQKLDPRLYYEILVQVDPAKLYNINQLVLDNLRSRGYGPDIVPYAIEIKDVEYSIAVLH